MRLCAKAIQFSSGYTLRGGKGQTDAVIHQGRLIEGRLYANSNVYMLNIGDRRYPPRADCNDYSPRVGCSS